MRDFDASKDWVILAPTDNEKPGSVAAEELSRRLGELRVGPVPVRPADENAPPEGVPIILLNAGDGGWGYSWRAGEDRVEIYGNSPKGLLDGVFDFLEALGFFWQDGALRTPHRSEDPADARRGRIPLSRPGTYVEAEAENSAETVQAVPGEDQLTLVARAAWSRAAAVRIRGKVERDAKRLATGYGLTVETDAPRPASLLPKGLYLFRPDLFPMEGGRRRMDRCFCPSSPTAIAIAARRAAGSFRRNPLADVYRFEIPPATEGEPICSCPACRAFSPREQALMAANAVAAGLESAVPEARLLVEDQADDDRIPAVLPRGNILLVSRGTRAAERG